QKGLAVVTIAEDAVHRPRSGVGHASLDLSAATAQLGLLAHTGCPRGSSADRCTGATDGVAGRHHPMPPTCLAPARSLSLPDGPMPLPTFLIVLVDVFALTLVIPLLAIYAEQFGATPFQATLLITVFAVCQLVSGPVLGRTSDRIGRKPMLLLSQAGTLIGLLVMASATSLGMIFVGRIIDGCTAGNLSLAQAWIAHPTKPEERAKSFALIGIAFGLGFFLGPSVTGYLAQYGLRAPIFAAAGMSATSILCTATLLRTVRPAAGSAGDAGPAGRRLGVFEW